MRNSALYIRSDCVARAYKFALIFRCSTYVIGTKLRHSPAGKGASAWLMKLCLWGGFRFWVLRWLSLSWLHRFLKIPSNRVWLLLRLGVTHFSFYFELAIRSRSSSTSLKIFTELFKTYPRVGNSYFFFCKQRALRLASAVEALQVLTCLA